MSPSITKSTSAAAQSRSKHHAASAPTHPGSVPIPPARKVDEAFDQPFAGGVADELDSDLRHRLVSEAAFRRTSERGGSSDYDDEDWRDAAADVEHVLVERPVDAT